jgi:hypothetical protein
LFVACGNVVPVPRICLRAVLQASPELLKLFGEDPETSDNLSLFTSTKAPPPAQTGRLPSATAAAGRPTKQPGMDTPRGFEEELTEEQLLQLELEKVKHEREVLMQSIMSARAQAGKLAC